MIERGRMKFDQRSQLRRGELAHMGPHAEVVFDRSAKNSLGLLSAERAALAEDVNVSGEFQLCGGGNHVLANNADVLLGIFPMFWRDHVRRQQQIGRASWRERG